MRSFGVASLLQRVQTYHRPLISFAFITFIADNTHMRDKNSLAKANKAKAAKKKAERSIAIIGLAKSIKTVDDVLSDKVLKYSVNFLSNGGTWNDLRQKLGLGPSWEDWRWRRLRKELLDAVLPTSEEDALQGFLSRQEYLVSQLEKFVDEMDSRIEGAGEKTEHHMLKQKLDGMKLLLEQNDKEFMNFIEMKKLKSIDGKKQGVSIIFNNINYVPRPGDNTKDVSPKKVIGRTIDE